jgi:hypothetical protein
MLLKLTLLTCHFIRKITGANCARLRTMPTSREELLRELKNLMEEYSAFQRSQPHLPQGNLGELSQDELELLVVAFQHRKAKGEPPVPSGLH